jgi:hypothetical protein
MAELIMDYNEIADRVDEYTSEAKGIAFDTCHKIYILMDDEQVELQRSYGYGDANDPDSLLTSEQLTSKEMTEKVIEWFLGSCGLRFISAVSSDKNVGHDGFVNVIAQFEADEDEDEDEDDGWWEAESSDENM